MALKAVEDFQVAIELGQVLELQRMLAARPHLVKLDKRALNIRARQFVGLQPLHFLAPACHLAGTRARRESRDKLIELRNLLFALRILRFQRGPDLRLRHHHVVITAGVSDDGLIVDIGGVRRDAVQKMAVVRNRDQRAVIIVQKILQPVDRSRSR